MTYYKPNGSSYVWLNTLSFKNKPKLSFQKWKEIKKHKFGLPIIHKSYRGRSQFTAPLYNLISPTYLNYGRFLNPQIGGGTSVLHNSLSYSSLRFNSRLLFKKPTLKPRNASSHSFNSFNSFKSPWDKFWWNSRWGSFHGSFSPFQYKINALMANSSNLVSISPLKAKKKKSLLSENFKIRLLPPVMQWGVKALEFVFNRRIYLEIRAIDYRLLSPMEYLRCEIWISKLKNFTRTLGAGFFLKDTVYLTYLSLRFHNPYLMIEWLQYTLMKISFWKYRSLFHFLRYIFRFFFWPIFNELGVTGVKFKLKGKISVSGNARTRSISTSAGRSGHTTKDHRIIHLSRLVPSFTGVMGFQIWFFF